MNGSSCACSCGTNSSSICPCDMLVHPQVIWNPPGRSTISYRVGDYISFREALLRARPGEVELANWRPGAGGDLAVQMVEWWAYLADILTFYNERIANEDYLRTAVLPESVQRLIRILGYRPRPGIGATGVLAALMAGNKPLTLPKGFQIQSKPGPGKQPQIFELGAQTTIQKLDIIAAFPPDNPSLLGPDGHSVLLAGVITTIKSGTEMLLVSKTWNATDSGYAVVYVGSTALEREPNGRVNTRVSFQSESGFFRRILGNVAERSSALPFETAVSRQPLAATAQSMNARATLTHAAEQLLVSQPTATFRASSSVIETGGGQGSASSSPTQPTLAQLSGANAADYRLMKTSLSALVWQYFDLSRVIYNDPQNGPTVHLNSLARQIHVGDVILFDQVGGSQAQVLALVNSYTEDVYYVNPGSSPNDPSTPPPCPPTIPIPIPHSVIGFTPSVAISNWNVSPSTLVIRYAWQDAGTLIATPRTTLSGTQLTLPSPLPSSILPMTDQKILVSDTNGKGVEAEGTSSTANSTTVGLSSPNGPSDSSWATTLEELQLQSPLSVLFDLLPVSRGKTVANEVLGSGDATIAGQEFQLQKSPLTYLNSAPSNSGAGYSSTLQVWVDGVQWKEVPSFYGQAAKARIFVTREDEKNITHVQFGDGVFGSRLPSGTNNVVAAYRYGSGADSPDLGSLTVILKPWPGLKSILNPVLVGGGADPDPPQQIKTYAPKSVLTFGRAVSADDYEVIAAQAPGVSRARSYWSWDNTQQRMMVKVYVGDDAAAVSSAITALAGASDPNRPINVLPAQSVSLNVSLTLLVDPNYVLGDVVAAATAALVDPDAGLLGRNVVQIGQSIFQSQIYQVCMGVPGALAIHSLTVTGATGAGCACCADGDYRFDPGEGGYFIVSTTPGQIISPEVGNAD